MEFFSLPLMKLSTKNIKHERINVFCLALSTMSNKESKKFPAPFFFESNPASKPNHKNRNVRVQHEAKKCLLSGLKNKLLAENLNFLSA